MNIVKYLIVFILVINCSYKEKENKIDANNKITSLRKDSLDIQNLIREVYEWNNNNNRYYFNIGIEDDKYSLVDWNNEQTIRYIGVDWDQFNDRKKELEGTKYFSSSFIRNYKNVLKNIDVKIKNGEYKWFKGYLPPFGTGANEWCHCQDYPDQYWKTMIIKTINLNNNSANLTWDWGQNIKWNWIDDYKNGYPLSVIKEDGLWKVSYMDGFDQKHY